MKSWAKTDIGRLRKSNQDSVFATDQKIGSLSNLYIVADGMGGHNAGDFASKFTIETVTHEIEHSEEESPIRCIANAIQIANQKLIETASSSVVLEGMGTTIVVATVVEDHLYVANVGDSRLYRIKNVIQQITRDHSWVEEMVLRGEMTHEQARVHPDKNIITRAVGAMDRILIDFFDLELNQGDFFLMCSDGLSNMVEDQQMLEVVSRDLTVEEKAKILIDMANEQGGRDNISVILAEYE